MNDRFKFRIYDKGNEQYLDPEDMDCVCHLPNGCFTIATWDGIQGDMKYWADEDIVVEMSTGLKDKNGNLIYEGDILLCERKIVDCATGAEIHYKSSGVVQRDKNGIYFINGKDWYGSDITFYNECAEIIGNIHEQAEQRGAK